MINDFRVMSFEEKGLHIAVAGFLSYLITLPIIFLLVQEEFIRDKLVIFGFGISAMSFEGLLVVLLVKKIIYDSIVSLFK